jgi:hypothetical protein
MYVFAQRMKLIREFYMSIGIVLYHAHAVTTGGRDGVGVVPEGGLHLKR